MTSKKANIKLGDLARDRITGFEGIVIARTEWMNQCDRYTIQPRELREGKPVESQTFDEQDLTVIEVQPFEVKASRTTGGPRPEPVRR